MKYQNYYSSLCLDMVTDKDKLYDVLFQVDYSQNNYKGKLVIDMSFTYIHWKMAE
jgi:3-hydroxyisobutyrate dehydrogenase-like beta-hydroxyacid dehydrogenase